MRRASALTPTVSQCVRAAASFSSTIYNDKFFVIVPLTGSQYTFFQTILKPFDPFTPLLWLVIFLVFGLVGVNLTLENHPTKINWWDFMCTGSPTAVLRGLNAYNLGEVPGVELLTSGSWLTAFFIGFTFQVAATQHTPHTQILSLASAHPHPSIPRSLRFAPCRCWSLATLPS